MSGDQLYPIIRRVRRPLIIQDDDSGPPLQLPAVAVPVVEPEKVDYRKPAVKAKGKGKHKE